MADGRISIDATSPGVDAAVIERLLDDVGGEVVIVHDVIDSYIERAPELADGIAAATGAADLEGVRRLAHDLRSISGFVGAESIETLAADLDSDGLTEDRALEWADELDQRLPFALAELRRLADELAEGQVSRR